MNFCLMSFHSWTIEKCRISGVLSSNIEQKLTQTAHNITSLSSNIHMQNKKPEVPPVTILI